MAVRFAVNEMVAGSSPALGAMSESGNSGASYSACSGSISSHARQAIVEWCAALFPSAGIVSLDQVAAVFHDTELDKELERLNAALYARTASDWNGANLAQLAQRLRKRQLAAANRTDETLALYPGSQPLSPAT